MPTSVINISDPSGNPSMTAMYLAYHNVGSSLDLIIPASAVYIVAICGVIMNSFTVYATIRTSSLRGTANYLMALICLLEVMHQSGHTLFFTVTVTGINFIGLLNADLIMIPMLFGANSVMMALLSAAADRLFAVAAPIQHKKLVISRKFVYLLGHTALCVLFGLFSLHYIISFAVHHPGIPTTGCISETLSGEVGNLFFVCTTILNIGCIICYVLIWLFIRCKNGVTKETNTRLLRSLVLIMLVNIGGYLINLSVYQVIFTYGDQMGSPIRVWQFGFIAGVLLNMGAASNAPILYLNSTEYRKVFKQTLRDLAESCGLRGDFVSTSVQHISNSPHHQHNSTQQHNPYSHSQRN